MGNKTKWKQNTCKTSDKNAISMIAGARHAFESIDSVRAPEREI